MNKKLFATLNTILKKDSKDATYKFALLRALVEISEEAEHHIVRTDKDMVVLPLGLIINKWLYYYYSFIEQDIPQRNGEKPGQLEGKKLSFRRSFKTVTDHFCGRGGFSAFVRQYRDGKIPDVVSSHFLRLLSELHFCICRYPMKHLGYSVYREHYKVVSYNQDKPRLRRPDGASGIDPIWVIVQFGTFNLRRDFFELFRVMGDLIIGKGSIIQQWAEFTANANSKQPISVNTALATLTTRPVDKRLVAEARSIYQNLLDSGRVCRCVWSGRKLSNENLVVDHMIPFSIWSNNDLWNLLPAHARVNSRKSDAIPAPALVRRREGRIREYWCLLKSANRNRYRQELQMSLLGSGYSGNDWEQWLRGIHRLVGPIGLQSSQYFAFAGNIQRIPPFGSLQSPSNRGIR